MPRKCKFDTTKKCGYTDNNCQHCEIRKKLKQKMLTPEPPEQTQTITIDYTTKIFCCPFCLYRGDITKFYVKIKKGVSEKRFKCPECGEVMRRETLTKDMTIEQYAQWVYDTGAWERIKFSTWKKRLKDYGWSFKFWDEYKRHKTEMLGETETYQQYIERKQREQLEEEEDYY